MPWSTSATAASTASDPLRGVRYRLCHRPWGGVLRAPQEQGPTGAAYVNPLSTGITFALTEKAPVDKIPVISMGYGRSESRDGKRVPVELPAARHLLVGCRNHHAAHRAEGRRLRQAQGQEDRAGLSRLALRQEPIALLEQRAKMHGFEFTPMPVTHPGVEQKATWAADPPEPAGLCPAVGLGRHELDVDQGGGGRRLPARQDVRRVVVGCRTRRASGRGCAKATSRPCCSTAPASSAFMPISRNISTTRARARQVGRGWRGPLQPWPGQRHAGRRGDPQGADQVR